MYVVVSSCCSAVTWAVLIRVKLAPFPPSPSAQGWQDLECRIQFGAGEGD